MPEMQNADKEIVTSSGWEIMIIGNYECIDSKSVEIPLRVLWLFSALLP